MSQRPFDFSGKTILHIITGSIAAYKAGDLVQKLRETSAKVVCVLTPSAKYFVTPLVLRAISGNRVYDEFFSAETPYDVLHTSLAEEANAILIAPASADFLAKLAHGFADDLGSCVVLATRRPIVIVPAMNDQMYAHPLTRENIQKLKKIGYHFVDPVKGHLVCGKEAIGHVADNGAILNQLNQILNSTSHNKKIRNSKLETRNKS